MGPPSPVSASGLFTRPGPWKLSRDSSRSRIIMQHHPTLHPQALRSLAGLLPWFHQSLVHLPGAGTSLSALLYFLLINSVGTRRSRLHAAMPPRQLFSQDPPAARLAVMALAQRHPPAASWA